MKSEAGATPLGDEDLCLALFGACILHGNRFLFAIAGDTRAPADRNPCYIPDRDSRDQTGKSRNADGEGEEGALNVRTLAAVRVTFSC